jgi:hypothetical protein
MVTAVRQNVTVQRGGVIEVRSADLREGDWAEVIVLVEPPAVPPHRATWSEFVGSAAGAFKSVAEVDAYIRELRDEWEH